MSRIKYKKPRVKRVKKPAPIPPPKPDRPRRSNLRSIYRDLLTTDVDQRVTTLAKAMEWYSHCYAYILHRQEGKLTLPQLKAKNAAERARTQGITTSQPLLKEKSFISAVKFYEKAFAVFKPPLISRHLRKYSKEKRKLIRRKDKLTKRFNDFLGLLTVALKPKNQLDAVAELRVDKLSSDYRIDSEGNITIDRKLLGTIKRNTRKYGLLPGVCDVLPILAEAQARTPELDPKGNKTGRVIVSAAMKYAAVLSMLKALIHYCLSDPNPRKLIRRAKPKPKKES